VQLLDRAAFPRNKPCGGAISLRALRRFPYLDEALVRMPTRRLSRLYLESPSGQGITLTSHVPAALMARRVDFPRAAPVTWLAVRLFPDAQRRCVEPGRHSRPQPDMRS
jgi:hypothetical protein